MRAKATTLCTALAVVCTAFLPLAAGAAGLPQSLAFINSNLVTAAAGVHCRFVSEYNSAEPNAVAADARTVSRAVLYSGTLSDAVLQYSGDGRTLSGLGLVFDYDVMNDTGRGRMSRQSGNGDASATIAAAELVASSLRIADVTPADGSLALDWLRKALPPAAFLSLDRIAAGYRQQGWSAGKSAGACALGGLRLLEIRWKTVHGEEGMSAVLWPQPAAEFEKALKAILAPARQR